MSTLVSILIPVHNAGRWIEQTIESALSQTWPAKEVIVVDDGSTDRTAELIEEIAARLPRLRVLHHERNLGIWATFEHLYAEAGNELVFLNSTDGQWDTAILFDMLPLTSQWDVIIATRLNKHYGFGRRFISWGFNLVPRIIWRRDIRCRLRKTSASRDH